MTPEQIARLNWDKSTGLLPAIVQHALSGAVLMLGYMNRESLAQTLAGGRVVFYSRSRECLWLKGETSGNFLDVVDVGTDCDSDALLILAKPVGPVCHTGTPACFSLPTGASAEKLAFLAELEAILAQRIAEKPQGSYTAQLIGAGTARMAQKIGEEGVEVALAAVSEDNSCIVSESADLVYHLLLLLKSRNLSLQQVADELQTRHAAADRRKL